MGESEPDASAIVQCAQSEALGNASTRRRRRAQKLLPGAVS
ncbi:hypothetical protein [Streptomyces curacoi]